MPTCLASSSTSALARIIFRSNTVAGDRPGAMGTFQDRTSMDHILCVVFTGENNMQKVSASFLVAQNN
jgi:hypothetical protein